MVDVLGTRTNNKKATIVDFKNSRQTHFSPPRTPSYRNVTCCIHIHTVVRPCVVRLVGFYIVDSFADLWAIMDSAPSVYQELFLNSQQLCCIRIQ
jgi:hypothetical protein